MPRAPSPSASPTTWSAESTSIAPEGPPGFTQRYNVTLLVHAETYPNPTAAIAREKQIKGWVRAKKIALIESENPEWRDLSAGWFDT